MGAGLEVDVDRSALSLPSGRGQRQLLGVGASLGRVEALAGDLSRAVQDDRADHRIGAGAIVGGARELDGARHPTLVVVVIHCA